MVNFWVSLLRSIILAIAKRLILSKIISLLTKRRYKKQQLKKSKSEPIEVVAAPENASI
ncbi:hypothetical protein [Candidatus Mycoplasma haematominutum]|uniref:Uncharacterized protein n=1 Tax=Candidatus Mycoplasma haematominutum 'Birmingham 1' TaxID=1116213 RepID=G8C3D2_9MOLU|nr:hypothetical protein [Candidatus Mycoplasma haematominutum]CCE66830.1 hypothetical protein MHM_03120 [Candidatus Mycoplasma haematominutum 'Birmingham 1']